MNNEPIAWYYDPISPFAWLAWRAMGAAGLQQRIKPRPLLLAGLLQANGQLGPAEIPAKRRFTYRYARWLAARQGLTLRFPPAHPFNPLPALRLALAAGSNATVVSRLLDFVWREGRDPSQPDELVALADQLGIADPQAALADPEIKQELRRNGEAALACGVFGVPTAVLGDELYWGQDAVPMLVDRLQQGDHFNDSEMVRLDALPVGVERPRERG
jgi:2-hydroxychromene-2-carboxylate isomerase